MLRDSRSESHERKSWANRGSGCCEEGDSFTGAEKEADDERIKQRMKEYKDRLRALQFKEVVMADETGQYKHYHNYLINGVKPQSGSIDKRGVHNQKRMLHMAKEISSLSTTLPLEWESSIHLYVDQNRLDVLRALIIGPGGTPYQNGIFQFDIYLPPGKISLPFSPQICSQLFTLPLQVDIISQKHDIMTFFSTIGF